MICRHFEQLAPQIAHGELRDAKLLQDATNHAARCGACSAVLVEAREIAASVAALAAHDKAIDSAGHLEFRLRAAFAREYAGNAVAGVGLRRARFAFNWQVFALAGAAITFTILLVPSIVGHKSEPNRAAITAAHAVSPAVADSKIVAAPTVATPVTQKHLAAAHKPKKNLAEPETTLTGFLALPYADDISTIEYGAIVRLQMSRSDLAWLGLPVPISDTGEKVTADLFVNGSGTPEAIRLVK
jgi:hypothetical protein